MQIIDYQTTKFVMIPQSLALDKSLTHRDKMVYIALSLFMDNNSKQAYPSAQTLAEIVGVGRNSVFRALKSLESIGYIRREKRAFGQGKQTTNVYYLLDKR
ncbi:helix-turn-helix domain-containing protein [Lysinibacillus xylanilyticus]|uniref:Helix-turn-helix domain-containing protein n=1 Tax=Lysinibacillus xylanilyticus TaxID=582475 RepID=A0ABT4EM88_9BACI|nr:helix-turn-helix domain-containing protein [Lysinibacillus xylanilyticus]MCY9546757.1 helix-turn-helix domain-containing protein [Lysinibacillus xylanilyticus]